MKKNTSNQNSTLKIKFQIDTNLIVTAIIIIVSWIQCSTRLGIDFACIQTQKPDLWIFVNLLTFIVCETAGMQTQCLCKNNKSKTQNFAISNKNSTSNI